MDLVPGPPSQFVPNADRHSISLLPVYGNDLSSELLHHRIGFRELSSSATSRLTGLQPWIGSTIRCMRFQIARTVSEIERDLRQNLQETGQVPVGSGCCDVLSYTACEQVGSPSFFLRPSAQPKYLAYEFVNVMLFSLHFCVGPLNCSCVFELCGPLCIIHGKRLGFWSRVIYTESVKGTPSHRLAALVSKTDVEWISFPPVTGLLGHIRVRMPLPGV